MPNLLPTNKVTDKQLTKMGNWLAQRTSALTIYLLAIIAVALCWLAWSAGLDKTREWMSALSGWVAAITAIGIGYTTLRKMQLQNELTAKQKRIDDLNRLIAETEVGLSKFIKKCHPHNPFDNGDTPRGVKIRRTAQTQGFLRMSFNNLGKPDYDALLAYISPIKVTNEQHIEQTGSLDVLEDIADANTIVDMSNVRICSLIEDRLGELTAEMQRLEAWKNEHFLD